MVKENPLIKLSARPVLPLQSRGVGIIFLYGFALGLMEALAIPSVQAYFRDGRKPALGWGNGAIFILSCLSLLAGPIYVERLHQRYVDWMGLTGAAAFGFLMFSVLPLSPASKGNAKPPQTIHLDSDSLTSQGGILFALGAGLGSLTNMIYPIAMRMLALDPLQIGLYAATPVFSLALGSWLYELTGARSFRWMAALAVALPAALVCSKSNHILSLLMIWSVSLWALETSCLYEYKNLNQALSWKYFGVASGIILSGCLAGGTMANPLGSFATSAYVLSSVAAICTCAMYWSGKKKAAA